MSKKYKQLSELGEIITGKTPSTANRELWGGNIPFITPTDINGYTTFYQIDTERTVSEFGANKQKKTVLPPNSVCITCIGSTIGKPCVTKVRSITNQQINSIIPNNNNDYRYVYYLLRLNLPYLQLIGGGSGAGTPIISKNKFSKFKFLVEDDLPTQRRIASILSAYDNLIENNNKRIRLLEQMAENLYKEWFVRFRFPGHEKVEMVNGLPKGWSYQRLDEIASINMGQSPSSSFYNEEQKGLPFHQGVGSYGDYYLKDEIYSTQGAKVAEPNSIIFSVRAPVGRINITLNKIYLGRGVAAINSLNGNNGFLYWSLRSKFAKEDTIGNGAIFSSVTKDELGRQKMLVPDTSIVAKFESVADKMENLIRDIYKQNKSLTRQRDLLLPRLMSGKLEVKE